LVKCKLFFRKEKKMNNETNLSDFARRLRVKIVELNLSDSKVAIGTGFTSQTIGNWCNGKSGPDPYELARLADFLEITDFNVFFYDGKSEAENEINELKIEIKILKESARLFQEEIRLFLGKSPCSAKTRGKRK
jgi:transcriptional regulator with XRE-family HTH domain